MKIFTFVFGTLTEKKILLQKVLEKSEKFDRQKKWEP